MLGLRERETRKLGFIKQVDKGQITTLKDLEKCYFVC